MDTPFLTLVQACGYLAGESPSTMRQRVAERKIPCYKPNKKLLFRKSDLDAFVESSRRASIEQLNQELEQKRQELNRPIPGTNIKGKGAQS
jgi:excisionase family DNA binding protein